MIRRRGIGKTTIEKGKQELVTATLPEISGHGPIFSVYSSVYAIVEVNGRRWELGIKHRR